MKYIKLFNFFKKNIKILLESIFLGKITNTYMIVFLYF